MSCRPIVCPEDKLPFETGVHEEGSLIVVSIKEDRSSTRIPEILDLLWDKKVEEAYVYLAGFSSSIDGAKKECDLETTKAFLKVALERAGREKTHLVGCTCDWNKKMSFAEEVGIDLIQSDCGGSETLGRIAAEALRKDF